MTNSTTTDRRTLIRDRLAAMARLPAADKLLALREIATSVLTFSPVSDAPITVDATILPSTANVIARVN